MLPVTVDLNKSMVAGWNTNASKPEQPRKKKLRSAIPLNGSPALPVDSEPIASGSGTTLDNIPGSTSGTATPTNSSSRVRPSKKAPVPLDQATLAAKHVPPMLKLSNMAGLDSQIQQLVKAVILPLKHPNAYRFVGGARPGGVLLHGVPGGGKTQLVRCLAGELGLPFISVSAPSIVSGMSGESEKTLREMFDEAKKLAPCLLFMDEVDAITPKRETAQREMERRIVAQMLTCMDDLAATSDKPVVVIGATNRPDALDPALRRAGRFEHEIEMGVPTVEGRESILQVLCSEMTLDSDVDLRWLAKETPGYVGADLTSLTKAAGTNAVERSFMTMASRPNGDSTCLTSPTSDPNNNGNENGDGDHEMATDPEPETELPLPIPDSGQLLSTLPSPLRDNPLINFVISHPSALSESEVSGFAVSRADFTEALKTVQPSAKREGFATVPNVTWADIGALSTVREELEMAIVEPMKEPETFEAFGINAPSGVLLWGPPGCGKTLLAKAVASESRANFISVKGPELLNKYVGESEKAVRQVFARARASSPCVIFFDELDALVPRRDDSMSESSARVVNTLLTELDGLDARKAVYVIGATNRPDMIDPAMIRPGRLDKLIYVDLPSPAERLEILKTHTKRTPLQADSQTEIASIVMSSQCDGFSGADIAALVKEASSMATMAYMRARRQAVASGSRALGTEGCVVTVDHFREAAKKTLPSVGRDQIRKFERMRDRYAGLPSKGKRMRDEAEIAVAAGAAAGAAATEGVGAEDVRMAALVG